MKKVYFRPYSQGDEIADALVLSEEAAQKLNQELRKWLDSDEGQEWIRNQKIEVVHAPVSHSYTVKKQ